MDARIADESRDRSLAGVLICGGAARLPGGPANGMLVIEMEVDRDSLCILEVHVGPEFGGLRQLLKSELEGTSFADVMTNGGAAISERYLSPFRNAARAALRNAAEHHGIAQGRPDHAYLRD